MKPYKISVCLLTKDENEYLDEWLTWHIGIGIEHFYIYDNGSKIPVVASIRAEYQDVCTVVDFSGAHEHTQVNAYSDCLERFGCETKWLAFIDTDEFIRMVDGTDISTFLDEYSESSIAVRWIVYNADGQLHKVDKPVRDRFRKVAHYPDAYPQCKCIVQAARTKKMGAHYPIFQDGGCEVVSENHEKVCYPAEPIITCNRIAIDHYFTRSYEEWQEKMERGSCDPYSVREPGWFDRVNPDMVGVIKEYM